ncbi:MAG: hypothetical protein JOZ15_21585, partial [Acidobacteria bacterium]|nr:hypothetical protein [Acidobacteriota bacterium]
TLGVMFLLVGIELKLFGSSPEILTAPLLGVTGFTPIDIGSYSLGINQVEALATAGLAAFLLALLLNRSLFGLGVLASAQDAAMARLLGIPARWVSAFTWIVAMALGGLAGLIIVPTKGGAFAAFYLSGFFYFRGLVAALLGGMGSLTGAVIGGIVIGEIDAFAQIGFSQVQGAAEMTLLVVVLLTLVARPQGLFAQKAALA